MAEIYWIRTKEMTDVLSEGYVGYTSKNTGERWAGHLKEAYAARAKNYPVYNNIRKLGAEDIVVETLVIGPEEYCLVIENKLRSTKKIGWNLQVGGNKGCDSSFYTEEVRERMSKAMTGRIFSDEHKAKIAAANRQRIVSTETKKLMSEQRKGVSRPSGSAEKQSATLQSEPWRNRSVVDKSVWLIADKIFEHFVANPSIGIRALAKVFAIESANKFSAILKKLRNGWNPITDLHWLRFKETYGVSQ